jgi:hypothetical protein
VNSSSRLRPISRLREVAGVLQGWFIRQRPKLTIVTAVSRPENLSWLKDNLSILKPHFKVCWCCVVDSTKATLQQIAVKPDILKTAKSEVPDAGATQRNVALSLIRNGWIYFLDNDNLIHPNFPRVASETISANPAKKCFVFAQAWWDNTHRLSAGPIKPGKVDTGSFLVHRSVIGEAKWSLNPVPASVDFNFITQIWQQKPEQFLFVNEVCTYYNRLRPGQRVI